MKGLWIWFRCAVHRHGLPPDFNHTGLKNGDVVACSCGKRQYEVWLKWDGGFGVILAEGE